MGRWSRLILIIVAILFPLIITVVASGGVAADSGGGVDYTPPNNSSPLLMYYMDQPDQTSNSSLQEALQNVSDVDTGEIEDVSRENLSGGGVKNLEAVGSIAQSGDAPLLATPSTYAIDGRNFAKYRSQQVEGITTSKDQSHIIPPHQGQTVSSPHGYIKEAYVALISTSTATHPHFTKPNGNTYKPISGATGNALFYIDYREDPSAGPPDIHPHGCGDSYTYTFDQSYVEWTLYAESGEGERKTIKSGTGAGGYAVSYNVSEWEDATFFVDIDVTAEYTEHITYRDLDCHDDDCDCEVVGHETNHLESHAKTSDNFKASIHSGNEIRVIQNGVQYGPQQYLLEFELWHMDAGRPHHTPGMDVAPVYADEMYYWSVMSFDDRLFVESDWKLYTEQLEWSESATEPNQLVPRLYNEPSGPSVISHAEGGARPHLVGWTSDRINVNQSKPPKHVNVNVSQPDSGGVRSYTQLAIDNAPHPATSLLSITGQQRNISSEHTHIIPYQKPQIAITEEGKNNVQIQLLDQNDAPIADKQIFVSHDNVSGKPYNLGSDGAVTVSIPDGYQTIEVTYQGRSPESVLEDVDADVYYGSVSGTKIVGSPPIVSHIQGLIRSGAIAFPFILFYYWYRDRILH